ncbi:uncharacterized protein LOC114922890 [Protobothrops mucrosquamatus]|uniref:uncharacterized protein LOC114922890 n=1 Tax=Protobothrops mucrosquamatus TaxID=103944 RepID=UPI0010FB9DF5|nr:uncharacterized protein LOC114922890 [Protobothrops mucrosquamatus]
MSTTMRTVVNVADKQVDAYENVRPDVGVQRGQRLLQKGKILPNTLKMEDEEEYECPDSETELKSDDEENYENAQEEEKPGDVTLNDVLIYENKKDKVKFDLRNGNLDDSWYSNKTEQILENLTQDQDPIVEECLLLSSLFPAPPLVKHGSTNVQLTKPSTVACTATDFCPGKISMTWFQNDRIVQGPEQPPAQPSNSQLFRAESVLKLIPEFSDANANFSCHIHHQAHEGPEVLNFRLQLQGEFDLLLGKQGLLAAFLQLSSHSLFILTHFLKFGLKGRADVEPSETLPGTPPPPAQHGLITRPQGEKFVAAECNVNKFYPSQIHIQWLQNGVPQECVKSEVHRMPNGMFSINSVLFPQTSNVKLTYVCRVEHEALETPLEQSVHWRPGEGDAIIHPDLPVKKNSVTGTSNEKKPLQKTDEEKVLDSSNPKTGETSSGLIPTEEFNDVQEQRL